MAIIPQPAPGQPIDYGYINSMVTQINKLTTSFSSTNTQAVLQNATQTKYPLIVTVTADIPEESKDAGKTISQQIPFGSNAKFAKEPVVNVTFQPNASTSKMFSVAITDITSTQITVNITNVSSSKQTIGGRIHVIAIGQPTG